VSAFSSSFSNRVTGFRRPTSHTLITIIFSSEPCSGPTMMMSWASTAGGAEFGTLEQGTLPSPSPPAVAPDAQLWGGESSR